MNLAEMVHFSFDALNHQKLRSFLTVLGIIVGISSVILLVGLVQGLKQDVLSQLEDFGPRTIIITPTNPEKSTSGMSMTSFAPTSGKLFEKDYEKIKKIPEIQSITKVIAGQTTVTFKNQSISSGVYGVEAGVFDDTVPVEIDSGRFIEANDRRVAGLGWSIADSFDEKPQAQSSIYLADQKFKVIGVLKEGGNSFAPMDSIIFIPFDDAKELFNKSLLKDEISAIRLTLKEGSDVDAVAAQIEDILLASHRVTEDDKDFGVITSKFINDQFSEVMNLLSLFLAAIASISLIVGGIGIANTMFMSVLERRKEIGTMKAVGASQHEIRNIFLVESAMIGLVGGFIGLVVAGAIGFVLLYGFGVAFVFDPLAIWGALAFSMVVGLVSGTFPAIEAAKIDPIEALRYE
ncbi:ABC transporter permease [Candidatus Micrarchaeota archaeon]|nr:ABC transporter permease [Candidatus Micrarchaeota archaeon]